jgi:hypothetical protein
MESTRTISAFRAVRRFEPNDPESFDLDVGSRKTRLITDRSVSYRGATS